MIWFLLYIAFSFPAVWVIGKLDSSLVIDNECRHYTAFFWPAFLIFLLLLQLAPLWDLIYFNIFSGEKDK